MFSGVMYLVTCRRIGHPDVKYHTAFTEHPAAAEIRLILLFGLSFGSMALSLFLPTSTNPGAELALALALAGQQTGYLYVLLFSPWQQPLF